MLLFVLDAMTGTGWDQESEAATMTQAKGSSMHPVLEVVSQSACRLLILQFLISLLTSLNAIIGVGPYVGNVSRIKS